MTMKIKITNEDPGEFSDGSPITRRLSVASESNPESPVILGPGEETETYLWEGNALTLKEIEPDKE